MAEFSKLVRARLAAQAAPAIHPDADVLTAFAEHRLSSNERTVALAHLSTCADCREVVALASQQILEPIALAEPARRRFLIWRLALVGALTVLAVGATVLLRLEKPRPTFVAEHVSPPALPPAGVTQEQDAKTSTDATLTKSERRRSKFDAESKNVNGSRAQRQAEMADALTTQSTPAPADRLSAREPQNAPVVAQRRAAAEPATALAPAPAPPSIAQPTQTSGQFAQKTQQTAPATQPSPQPTQQASSTAEVQPSTTRPQQQSASQPGRGTASGGGFGSGAVAGMIAGSDTAATAKAASAAPKAKAEANKISLESQSLATMNQALPAQWTISADGNLERSTQIGATAQSWQPIDVGEPATFRVVNSSGADVWAGGNAGALFHSSDAGEHWSRIVPREGDHKLDGDVVSITVSGTTNQNVRLGTSANQSWISSDGGKTWKKSR